MSLNYYKKALTRAMMITRNSYRDLLDAMSFPGRKAERFSTPIECILFTQKLDELQEKIKHFESLKDRRYVIENLHRQQEHAKFVNSFQKMHDLLKQNYEYYAFDQTYSEADPQRVTRYKNEIEQRSKLLDETLNFAKSLHLNPERIEEDLECLNQYIKTCNKKFNFSSESRLTNFVKAIGAVGIVTFDFLIGTALGVIAALSAPVVLPLTFFTMSLLGDANPIKKIISAFFSVLAGLVISPIVSATAILAGVGITSYLGYISGKEIAGIPQHDSISRHLFFGLSSEATAFNRLSKDAKNFIESKPETHQVIKLTHTMKHEPIKKELTAISCKI